MPAIRSATPGRSRLADIQQNEHWLLAQEAEPADRFLLVRLEGRRRGSGGPASSASFNRARTTSSRSFDSRSGGRAVATAHLEPLDPPVDEREVRDDELEVEALEVPGGVDRALGVRVRRVLECPDHVEQRVGLAQAGEMLGRQLLRSDPALRRGGRCREIDVRDVGLDDLLRLEDLGQPIEAGVGNLHHADVQLEATEAAGLGMAAGQRVEDGRLAGPGKPDDGDLRSVPGGRVDDVEERLAGGETTEVVAEQLDAAVEDPAARPRRVGRDDDVGQVVERRRRLERLVTERVEDRPADRPVAERSEES